MLSYIIVTMNNLTLIFFKSNQKLNQRVLSCIFFKKHCWSCNRIFFPRSSSQCSNFHVSVCKQIWKLNKFLYLWVYLHIFFLFSYHHLINFLEILKSLSINLCSFAILKVYFIFVFCIIFWLFTQPLVLWY